HGLSRSAFRLADELGLEALREARAAQRLPCDAPREVAHGCARRCLERREVDLSLHELRGHGDRQAPARGVAVGGGLLGLPRLADDGCFSLRHAAQAALDVARAYAPLADLAGGLDAGMQVMADGIERGRGLRKLR